MNVEVLKRIAKSHSSKLLALASVTSFALTLYSAWESFPRTRCDIDEADYISKKYSGQPISNGRKTLIFLKSNKKTITLAFATAVLMLLEYRTMEKQISTLKASYFLLNEQLKAGHQFPILNKDPSEEKSYITENFNSNSEEVHTFYIDHYNKFFERSLNEVIMAEYNTNREFVMNGCLSLSDLFKRLDIDPTSITDMLGWGSETKWINFQHDKVTLDDGLECYIIKIENEPTIDYLPF